MNCSRMSPMAKSEASSIMVLVLLSRKFWVKMQVFSISLFLYFSSFIFSFNILQSFLPSIFPLPLPPFSFLPFFIKFPTIFPPLSKLTLFIVSMLINYTKLITQVSSKLLVIYLSTLHHASKTIGPFRKICQE